MTNQLSVENPAPQAPGAATPSPGPQAPSASEGKPAEGKPSPRWRVGLVIAALVVTVLVGALIAATLPRLDNQKKLDAAAAQAASSPPLVSVATARRAPATMERTLPGNAQAFREAALFARSTGYLKRWLVDIGDRVKDGQLIAEISAPDVDDQLAQARANLVLAKANLNVSEANAALAETTLARDQAAGVGVGVSAQSIDQDKAQVKTTKAQIESAKANIQVNEATVQQFADLQSFQKIVAPFPGVITARNVDPGALITADNTTTRELFHVMQTDPLRVFVNVPQIGATSIAPGQGAVVWQRDDPTTQFAGKVTRTANALDPNTRTLLTEVDVPNPKDALRPGMYLQVKFVTARTAPSVLIPSAALVTRPDGSLVPILDENQAVRYRKVQLGRDLGSELEIVSGLEGGETVVVHPGDTLAEGQQVQAVPLKK
jgi:RND family efflux transporter MFP subunit